MLFQFQRASIPNNERFDAGGMRFELIEPFRKLRIAYRGKACRLARPLEMSDPRAAFTSNPWIDVDVNLAIDGVGPMYGGERSNRPTNPSRSCALADRRSLLQGLDQLKRSADSSGTMIGMDSFTDAAFGVLTSSRLADALDISKEPAEVRERYGDGKPFKYQYDGAPTCNEHILLARRLVEAGVRSVTLSFGRWDSHGQNFDLVRDHGGKLDQAVSALGLDLEERGMLNDVTILVWGEFGRTPRINPGAGRDHWPQVSCALMAGGGMRTGQAIGATNRLGEYAVVRPVDMQEIIGTAYHNLGIDVMRTTIEDPTGRPQFLVDVREPMRELV